MNTYRNDNQRKKVKNEESMNRKFLRFMGKRLTLAFFVIIAAMAALMVVVVVRATTKYGDYSRQVLEQQGYDNVTIPYKRGNITDKFGNVLATNEKVYNLILDPYILLSDKNITEPTVNALVSCYGYDKEEIMSALHDNSESNYYRYAKGLSIEEKERFTTIEQAVNNDYSIRDQIKGVWFEDEYRRIYPYDTMACDLIGFTSSDATDGYYGLEKYYNDALTGNDGRIYGIINSDTNYDATVKNPDDGYTVVTTIDVNLQNIIEKHMAEFNRKIGSKNSAVLIMDPNNGDVLAMASYPVFNLNAPYDLTPFFTDTEIELMTPETKTEFLSGLWSNFVVSHPYEPGSTAKPLTVASGLEENKISPENKYECDGYQLIGGWRIRCHIREGHGELSLTDAIVNSCNDSLMQISAQIGSSIFSSYQHKFGLGQLTGIDLPAEEKGLLYAADDMKEIDLATNSFGQNFTATVLQMTAAYSSIVNGGTYYEPHVVKKIVDSKGNIIDETKPVIVRRTVSETTSKFLVDAMIKTVDNNAAAVRGYSIGGKTGTAQKLPRDDVTYIVSLATFWPAENPQYMMFVVIDEPNVEDQSLGGYPSLISHDIIQDIITYANIKPDREGEIYSTPFPTDIEYDAEGVIIED